MPERDPEPPQPRPTAPSSPTAKQRSGGAGARRLERRLGARPPRPRPEFRARLRGALMAELARQQRPARLRLLIGAYLACGLALLALAALGALGRGPLG